MSKTKLFLKFSAQGIRQTFLSFDGATGQIPVSVVIGMFYEQDLSFGIGNNAPYTHRERFNNAAEGISQVQQKPDNSDAEVVHI
ncbi:MAG TPA: hypothetical protein PLO56_01100 [Rhodothermales bacterium]|nr:hypothetical protein [Rhodothermales bacterium]